MKTRKAELAIERWLETKIGTAVSIIVITGTLGYVAFLTGWFR